MDLPAADAYIALGANLGDREGNIRRALERLARTPGVRVVRVSKLLPNPAVGGPPNSPPFLNAAAHLATTLDPYSLLGRLLEIERALGRARRAHGDPRPIDLDLLLYGDRTIRLDDLTVPHPRMHERTFVLQPLAEIAPGVLHPTSGKTISRLLEELTGAPPDPAPAPDSPDAEAPDEPTEAADMGLEIDAEDNGEDDDEARQTQGRSSDPEREPGGSAASLTPAGLPAGSLDPTGLRTFETTGRRERPHPASEPDADPEPRVKSKPSDTPPLPRIGGRPAAKKVMVIATTVAECRALRAKLRRKRLALVPTMGALHEGHVLLMQMAHQHAPTVAVSIFVNPTQFGPREDFNRYPRPLDEDLDKCRRAGVELVFIPSVEEMYPPEVPDITVDLPQLSTVLEGKHRPTHFKGVCQVVAKLFNILQPNVAVFGQKDFQQLRIIAAMAEALNWPVEVVACPTLRDADGLALSSRNQYLSPEERQRALALSRALFAAEAEFKQGVRQTNRLTATMQRILLEPHLNIDYVAAVDPTTLKPVEVVTGPTVLAVAARVGNTRLIDNLVVAPGEDDKVKG